MVRYIKIVISSENVDLAIHLFYACEARHLNVPLRMAYEVYCWCHFIMIGEFCKALTGRSKLVTILNEDGET